MGARKKLAGAGALSAAAIATLAGAPAASADNHFECVICDPTGPPGLTTAFSKLALMKFPGATESVFIKVGDPFKKDNAMSKLETLGFPGNTANVFIKGE